MKESFVFTLSEYDTFRVDGSKRVNINDASEFLYTFWNPTVGFGKKQMYATPYRFTDEALDLLYVSLMVFCVDRSVSREKQDDAWTRGLELYIPVMAYEKWERCKPILIQALNFLTGDHWKIHFRERAAITDDENKYRKGRWHFRRSVRRIDTDIFCMLSGGLDSFIGAINLLKDGKKPIFVSHYGGGKGVKVYQDRVVNSLKNRYTVDPKRFFRFYAASKNGVEDTTRSRSLMFFAHAIALASGMGHHVDLYIPENGVISLNIPLTVMRLGSLSTRTTHPYFMGLLQKLLTELGLDISLINPFQMKTKGEMMKDCKDLDYLNSHYQYTLSCSHPDQGRWTGEDAGHCGECLPCTIRRAAIKAAGLTDASTYRHNYDTDTGARDLKSYKLGLSTPKDSYAAIQMSGPITERHNEYVRLYEEGVERTKELYRYNLMEHLFDTHFHLDLQKDRAAAIRDVEEKQIYTIAVTNLPDLYRKESVKIASKYIRFALGFHPELIHQYKRQIPLMWDMLPEVRYVGEVGLDLVDKSSEKEQEAFFSELVERCRYDSNKIFTIHSRRAVDKVLDILGDNYRFKAILHWFSGSKTELEMAIDRGCFFSVNGPMMKSKRFLDMLSLIPSSRLLIETDSPFTHYMGSYGDYLKSIKEELLSYKPEVDVWNNFRRLLGG